MKKTLIITALFVLGAFSALAQGPAAKLPDIGITATLALGEVTAMNADEKTLTLKTKDGDITVNLSDATKYQKASPANPADLKAATPAELTDIGIGDRLIASGRIAEDKKSMISRSVILMTKSDISKHQQTEADAWTKGINGKVTAIEPIKKEITVTTRSVMGERTIVISDTNNVKFRRYSPNSVKFSDAVAGSFTDVKTGDQIRARGARSEDGTRFIAEEVLSGSFRTAGGKITAIDAAKNEITIDDVVTKKPITISLNGNTVLRKFPEGMAQQYVARQAMMAAGGMRPPGTPGAPGQGAGGTTTPGATPGTGTPGTTTTTQQAGGNPPGGQRPQGGAPGQGGGPGGNGMRMGGGAGRGDLDSMLETLPSILLTDLKVGEAIAVSSSAGAEANRVTAIKLLAGIEPFLNAPAISLPSGAGRQQSPSINIPGLDGIGGF